MSKFNKEKITFLVGIFIVGFGFGGMIDAYDNLSAEAVGSYLEGFEDGCREMKKKMSEENCEK